MGLQPRCIVLDFDGTFTDVEQEAVPYVTAYRADLIRRYGDVVGARWDAVWEAVGRDPDRGWNVGGLVVAPAASDPYIRSTVTAETILLEEGLEPDAEARRELLGALYRTHYRAAGVVFRPDARATLERLLQGPWRLFVVSNSETDAVREKLQRLGAVGLERLTVLGGARKYVVTPAEPSDARFEALPERLTVEGLRRPLYPRRGHYYGVLRSIWRETDSGPEQTLVCGDIYELDLLLPGSLGAQVHLLARPTTPAFERRAVEALHGGRVGDRLRSLLEWLD